MSAIAPLPSEPTPPIDERARRATDDEAPIARPRERRAHVWYAFGRWLETWDVIEDEGFVLA